MKYDLALPCNISSQRPQPYEKQTEIEQLQYELTTSARRYAAESATLRQRVAELELQLAETRKEADEYFKGGLQTNLEATALGNQVGSCHSQQWWCQPLKSVEVGGHRRGKTAVEGVTQINHSTALNPSIAMKALAYTTGDHSRQ